MAEEVVHAHGGIVDGRMKSWCSNTSPSHWRFVTVANVETCGRVERVSFVAILIAKDKNKTKRNQSDCFIASWFLLFTHLRYFFRVLCIFLVVCWFLLLFLWLLAPNETHDSSSNSITNVWLKNTARTWVTKINWLVQNPSLNDNNQQLNILAVDCYNKIWKW